MSFVLAFPFVVVLLSLALLPQLAPHFWEDSRRRGALLLVLGGCGAVASAVQAPGALGHAAHEYAAFVVLLACLYVVAACVVVRLEGAATPARNTLLLAAGTCLASLVGTTGASMLLVRPLLRANAGRQHTAHTVVFFIFLVSNVGGLLTPLGDPPLFLGFLRGVPFFWTLRLLRLWAMASAMLLAIYFLLDGWAQAKEQRTASPSAPPASTPRAAAGRSLQVQGARNLWAFGALLAVMVAGGRWQLPFVAQQAAMVSIATLTYATTPAAVRAANAFSWAPIVEVGQVFAAIFASMPPALALLLHYRHALPLHAPSDYFWTCGLLSSVLDNAPCYVTFASLAAAQAGHAPDALAELAGDPVGAPLLEAVAAGAVTLGAATYIGNGPNLMVRSMAEAAGVRTPSFAGYVAWAAGVLLPVLACARWLS